MSDGYRKMYSESELKNLASGTTEVGKTGCKRMWTEDEIKAIAGGGSGDRLADFLEGNKITEINPDDFNLTQTKIRVYLFTQQNQLKKVILPDQITEIQSSAFYNCPKLTYIEIGKNVTILNTISTNNNKNNLTVKFKGLTPPATIQYGNAINPNDLEVCYVPNEAVETYKKNYYFKDFADKIVGY